MADIFTDIMTKQHEDAKKRIGETSAEVMRMFNEKELSVAESQGVLMECQARIQGVVANLKIKDIK